MTITKKTRLLPLPFIGSILDVSIDEGLVFKIRIARLAEGREHITVDWGDDTREVFDGNISSVSHTYPAQGDYRIRLSDDVEYISISSQATTSAYYAVYAPMVRGFHSNAKRLKAFKSYAFRHCVNLSSFDVKNADIETINERAFEDCPSLPNELSFPSVKDIQGTTDTLPFAGCSSITALHFAKANEEAIRALSGFDTAFGAANATVSFDL